MGAIDDEVLGAAAEGFADFGAELAADFGIEVRKKMENDLAWFGAGGEIHGEGCFLLVCWLLFGIGEAGEVGFVGCHESGGENSACNIDFAGAGAGLDVTDGGEADVVVGEGDVFLVQPVDGFHGVGLT